MSQKVSIEVSCPSCQKVCRVELECGNKEASVMQMVHDMFGMGGYSFNGDDVCKHCKHPFVVTLQVSALPFEIEEKEEEKNS